VLIQQLYLKSAHKIKTIEDFSCERLPASFEVSCGCLKSCNGELVLRLCLIY